MTNKQIPGFIFALGLAGCATAAPPKLPPMTPIANAAAISGKWQGMLLNEGSSYPTVEVIKPDGTWNGETNGFRSHGTYTIAGGVAHWTSVTTGATGTWVLRTDNGTEKLYGEGSNGVTFTDQRAP
ncbi:MAG: hypothetical protein KGI51_00135 [Rhodospirillales bacterium]|nr:hypothetical protein [Rhodospirillales bacterium]